MKIGSIVEITVNSNGFKGVEGEVISHWKQRENEDWDKGQIQISIIAIGTRILNKGEYKVIKN